MSGPIFNTLSPVAPGTSSAALRIHCAHCGSSERYDRARDHGWTFDPTATPFWGYYCPPCRNMLSLTGGA